jgi:arginase family enzyme
MSFPLNFGFEDPAAAWNDARLAYFFVSPGRLEDLGRLPGPTAIAHASRYVEMFETQTEVTLSRIGTYCEIINEYDALDQASRRVAEAKKQGIFPVIVGEDRRTTEKCCSFPLVALWGKLCLDEADAAVCTADRSSIMCGVRAATFKAFNEIAGKATIITAREIVEQKEKLKEALARINRPVYLSVDIDVLAPGVVLSPRSIEPGGLSYYALNSILETVFSGPGVVAADLVGTKEVEPDSPAAALCAQILVKLAGLMSAGLEK